MRFCSRCGEMCWWLPTRPALSSRITQRSSERIFPLKRRANERREEKCEEEEWLWQTQVSFNRKLWAETKCPFRDTQNTLYTHTRTISQQHPFSLLFPLIHLQHWRPAHDFLFLREGSFQTRDWKTHSDKHTQINTFSCWETADNIYFILIVHIFLVTSL